MLHRKAAASTATRPSDATPNSPAHASPHSSAHSSLVARFPAATRLFVLDTDVLMHDPTSLFRFEEHDLYVPMATLEELDSNKKGMSEVSRNARQASRYLEEMVARSDADIAAGIALET